MRATAEREGPRGRSERKTQVKAPVNGQRLANFALRVHSQRAVGWALPLC